jgi:hypothetical protein
MESHLTTGKPLVEPARSTHEAEQLASYHSPSGLAIFSLLLGLASPLVFTAKLLMVIPGLGIAISLLALAKIAASDGQLFGRKAALVGLALAIASACAVTMEKQVVTWLVSRQARPIALVWFNHLRHGQVEAAFSLTTASQRPTKNPAMPSPFGSSNESPIDQFTTSLVVTKLVDWGEQAKVHFDKTVVVQQLPQDRKRVVLQFAVQGPAGLGSLLVALTMEKRGVDQTDTGWRVDQFQESGNLNEKL